MIETHSHVLKAESKGKRGGREKKRIRENERDLSDLLA
jgi:hypothetical protein